ncbi:MAG: lytic transglycosylase domain-containing protein [Arenibacterium sp.]
MSKKAAGALALALSFVIPGSVQADKPAPFPQFEAKRVSPPGAKRAAVPNVAKRRITVQIDPEEQAAILAARPPMREPVSPEAAPGEPDTPARKAAHDWFWDMISPELDAAGPGRLPEALRAISGSGKVKSPRLQAMQDIARNQGIPILRSTIGTSVSPALVLAVIAVESSGRTDAVSSAGAAGLMQLMPATADRFGVEDRMVADQNIAGGVKYLDWLMKEFNNDPILVLAGYNAGEGAVKKHGGVPPYAETRDYVPKVLAAFQVASGLCQTPPELITDGCVFVAMN